MPLDLEQPKDVMLKVRATKRGKNSKGGDRLELYLSQEEVRSLFTVLSELLDHELGVKMDIHTTERVAAESGRKFDASFFFIKKTQPPPGGAMPQKKGMPTIEEIKAAKADLLRAKT